jgi:DNA-binding transcriptional LysR family regulator
LFIRTARGVVPTERADGLAAPIAGFVAQAQSILEQAKPFDPSVTTRRFVIGAPDGVSTVLLPPLLAKVRQQAPGAAIGIRQLSPEAGQRDPEHAWSSAYRDLENRAIDIAIVPVTSTPASFASWRLFDEDFVVAARAGSAFAAAPSLGAYCDARHLVVSESGDPFGFVDTRLAELGLQRQTSVTVPNFMFALAMVAQTDLLAALPRRLVNQYAAAFGLVGVEAPLALGGFEIRAVIKKGAVEDAGLTWLIETLVL